MRWSSRRSRPRTPIRCCDRHKPAAATTDVALRQGYARDIRRVRRSARANIDYLPCAKALLSHPSNTHVSLVPPPWLELTTSEPALSATRVSPPGTMRTLSRPESTNGRKSTWRGATPASTQVGHVDKASVGWAMKFFGSVLSLARNCSIAILLAVGPR